MRTGEATWSTDARYFFDRDLPQKIFVTFTYGPILADDGVTVQGVFCPCTETTEKIVSRRRLETLHRLGIRTLDMHNARDAAQKVCAVLDENPSTCPSPSSTNAWTPLPRAAQATAARPSGCSAPRAWIWTWTWRPTLALAAGPGRAIRSI